MLMRILVVEDERDLNRVISKRLESEGYSIRFSVKDEGIGIAEKKKKKIWDRFYQVDPARCSSDGMHRTVVFDTISARGIRSLGRVSQPSRTPGAIVFERVPMYTTQSGARE